MAKKRRPTIKGEPQPRARDFGNDFGSDFGGGQSFGTMVLAVRDDPVPEGIKDGDIISAVSRLESRFMHINNECFLRDSDTRQLLEFNQSTGLIDLDSLAYDYATRIRKYRWERLSATEVRQVDQVDARQVVLTTGEVGTDLDGKTGVINVAQFVDYNLQFFQQNNARGIEMYGTPGTEIWFTGTYLNETPKVDEVWSAITNRTGKMETDPEFYDPPLGDALLKTTLWLRWDGFNDAQALMLQEPNEDSSGNIINARKRFVEWRGLREMAGRQASITDPTVVSDYREERKHVWEIEVQEKP